MNPVTPTLAWFMANPAVGLGVFSDFETPYLVLDFETTSLDHGHYRNPDNRIVAASWGREYKRGGEFDQGSLLSDIETLISRKGLLVAHNAKFELGWLARMGVDPAKLLVWDTMLGEYVLSGNRRWELNLGAVAGRYGLPGKDPLVATLIEEGVCPSLIPEHWLEERVKYDVQTTEAVFLAQRSRIRAAGLLPAMFTRCIVAPVLADLEQQRTYLDPARVEAAVQEARARLVVAEKKFADFSGGLNPRSGPSMARFIYEDLGFEEQTRYGKPIRNKPTKQFPGGIPKVDEKTLVKLKPSTKRQIEFIELRKEVGKVAAELSKTLECFSGICKEHGGFFYGKFNQAVTVTHRLSSSSVRLKMTGDDGEPVERGVQFQNFPNQYKGLICPSAPGRLVCELDGSQLEFRVAAFLGQDKQAITDIRNREDIHRFTASVINKVEERAVTAAQRKAAKPHSFKPLYGGQSGTEAEVRYYEAFREKYAGIYKTQKEWTYKVLGSGELTTATGLKFYWPHTRQSRAGYIDNTPAIFNYPIQSLASNDITLVGLAYLWHRLQHAGLDARIFNTVHDSAIADIKDTPETLDKFTGLGVQCFTQDVYTFLEHVYKIDFNVPLGVGIQAGRRWTEDLVLEDEVSVEKDGSIWRKSAARRD